MTLVSNFKMQQIFIIFCVLLLVGIEEGVVAQNATAAANALNSIVEFPFEKNPCTCKLLTCTCCQSVKVKPVQFEKMVCMEFKLNILFARADVTITVDNKTFAQFQIDPKTPPKYCVPIPDDMKLAMCCQLNDVKMVGLTAMQMCPRLYSTYQSNEVFAYKFPCVKLSSDGIVPARK